MSIKLLQIMLVIAAMLCAVGIAATFGREDGAMPADFNPPGWLQALDGLASGPRLDAHGLTRSGQPFPTELRLDAGEAVGFNVAPAEDADVRRAEFTVRGNVHVQYRPVSGQVLAGEPVQIQNWPTAENPDVKPVFVVYDRGGTITIRNRGPGTAHIGLED